MTLKKQSITLKRVTKEKQEYLTAKSLTSSDLLVVYI